MFFLFFQYEGHLSIYIFDDPRIYYLTLFYHFFTLYASLFFVFFLFFCFPLRTNSFLFFIFLYFLSFLFQYSEQQCRHNCSRNKRDQILKRISYNREYEDSAVRRHQRTVKRHGKRSCNRRSCDTGREHMKGIRCSERDRSFCNESKTHNKVCRTCVSLFFCKFCF